MAWQNFQNYEDSMNRAGYNQAGRISETLASLRNTYISNMMDENIYASINICSRVLDIIAGKVTSEKVEEMQKQISSLRKKAKEANQTVTVQKTGVKFYKNPEKRYRVIEDVEALWRNLEKLQDEYGYGMISEEDDTGL